MKRARQISDPEPSAIISGIFVARRDLLRGMKPIIGDSGFSNEEADLLVSLYGARHLTWTDLPGDDDGFVTYSALQSFLVHNPSLLSRRIAKLAREKLLETAGAKPRSGLHFNAKLVRLTDLGAQKIAPVWERYEILSAKILAGIPRDKLQTHLEVNQEICRRIHAKINALNDLVH